MSSGVWHKARLKRFCEVPADNVRVSFMQNTLVICSVGVVARSLEPVFHLVSSVHRRIDVFKSQSSESINMAMMRIDEVDTTTKLRMPR